MSCDKAVLFDLDGTLVDTYDLILASQRYATRTVLGRVISDERLMSTVGTPLEDQMADYASGPAQTARLCEVYREHNARVHDQLIKCFDGIQEQMALLAVAAVPMGIVTSKRADMARRATDLYGLSAYMRCIVGGTDTARHKPHPDPVLAGCRLLEADPVSCVYVGDSPFDIRAGNAAGCKTLAVGWGMFDLGVLLEEEPSSSVGQISQLASAIMQML